MSEKKRFVKVFSEGSLLNFSIYVDTETGVNYIMTRDGHAGGLTPLLDSEGKVVVTAPDKIKELE